MPEVDFLRVNPVTAGIASAQRIENERARNELLGMQAQRMRDAAASDRAASDALSRIYTEGGDKLSSEDVHRRLAADPNIGGSTRLRALETAERQSRQRQQVEAQARERDARAFKMYLDNGMDAAAGEMAKRMGINIPPDFWSNREQRKKLSDDLNTEAARAGIARDRAAAAASAAQSRYREPAPFDEYTDAEGRVVRVDRASGKSTYVIGPEGQPLASRGANPPRISVFQEKQKAWLDANPGDNQGALDFASGRRQATPADYIRIANAAAAAARSSAAATGLSGPALQKAYDDEFRRKIELFGLDPNNPAGVRQATPQAAQPSTSFPMADAEDVPRNADRKVDASKLVDGKVYRIPLRSGGQTTGRWNAGTGRFDEVR